MERVNHNMHSGIRNKATADSTRGMKHETSGHMTHTGMYKRKFFVCLILTFPVLLLSQTIQTWLHITIAIPYQTYILLTLDTILYVYGGWPFLKGVMEELRKAQPGMMTLIGMAISVAFFFSAATARTMVGCWLQHFRDSTGFGYSCQFRGSNRSCSRGLFNVAQYGFSCDK